MKFEPFGNDTQLVRSFDCGRPELNDFLNSEEVRQYEHEKLGKTTLVFYGGKLVAYYTLCTAQLRKEYVKHVKSFSRVSQYHVKDIPAVTIGRLAVDLKWQHKGIGFILIQRISMQALETSRQYGVRLLLVQAKDNAFDFYTKVGFVFVEETKEEKKRFAQRGTKTMFFDLLKLEQELRKY